MELLHPVEGRPLLRHGTGVFAMLTGHQIGAVYRSRVFNPAGSYLGTIEDDCLIYRTRDRQRRAAPFVPAVILLPETLDELADALAQQRLS